MPPGPGAQTCLGPDQGGQGSGMPSPTEPETPEPQADPGGDSDVQPDPARTPGDPYEDEDT